MVDLPSVKLIHQVSNESYVALKKHPFQQIRGLAKSTQHNFQRNINALMLRTT
jgi:hypothetical protein